MKLLITKASGARERPAGPEREPSSARSGRQREWTLEPIPRYFCRRARCEPRTARAPVAVSKSAWRPRPAALALALALVSLLSWGNLPCAAQTGTAREYALKAGVLYHIIEYVEWPDSSLSNNAPAIQIGLMGQIPFAEALEVLNGKTVQGRKLVVKRITDPQEAALCQVLFIGASEKPRISEIISEVKNRPVLTVGEFEGFAENGGMVNLVAGPNRIVMEINRQVASQARLAFSSQLLKLAKLVPR